VGDEPLLLARVAPTVIARDRIEGAHMAVAGGASVIVMDDGFQNPTLAKDCSIIAVDGETGIGNGLTFPAGPLRAALHAQMPFASAVVVIGPGDAGSRVWEFARGSSLAAFRARIGPDATAPALRGQRVLAFAGIGRPQKFFDALARAGATVAASVLVWRAAGPWLSVPMCARLLLATGLVAIPSWLVDADGILLLAELVAAGLIYLSLLGVLGLVRRADLVPLLPARLCSR
jgi:hypothetical protein